MNNLYYRRGYTSDEARFTLAARKEDKQMIMAASLCSYKDNFCKKKGRDIATGRLKKQKHILKTPIIESEKASDVLNRFTSALSNKSREEFLLVFNLNDN